MALKAKLMVIIDFHEHGALQKDPLGKKPMFLAIWKQVAEHYAGLPKEVLFEIANEPNMKPELWNAMHSEAYQIIRKVNPHRTLLIGPIYGNQIKYLKHLQLPEEDLVLNRGTGPTPANENLSVSFSMDGQRVASSPGLRSSIPTGGMGLVCGSEGVA
jgi:hypothetical protein